MKKNKLVLFSVLGLILAGCGGSASSETDSSYTSSVKKSSKTTSSAKKGSSGDDSDKESSSSKKVSSSSYDPYDTDWPTGLVDMMIQYLGGYVIPYIDISDVPSYEWDSYDECLQIEGDTWTDSVLTTAKNAFANAADADDWTVTTTSSSSYYSSGQMVVAQNLDKNVTVNVYKYSSYYSSSAVSRIDCYYDEPWDPTAATDWTSDTLSNYQMYLDNHTIPYFYMGSVNQEVSYSSYSGKLTVTGGDWNDQITSFANTALVNDGWDVTVGTSGSGSYYSDVTTLTATKTFADKCVIDLTLGYDYYNKAEMTLLLKEGFDPTAYTSWPASVIADMQTYLGNTVLPFIYLGTANPTSSWYSYSNYLEIDGGYYDTRMIQLAKDAFDNDPNITWTYTVSSSSSSYYGTEHMTANGVDSYGNQFKVVMSEDYYNKVELDCSFIEIFNIPAAGTTWPQTIQNDMLANLDNTLVPYIYLGTLYPTDTLYTSLGELDVSGGKWDDRVFTCAEEAFDNDPNLDWSYSYNTATVNSSSKLTAYAKTANNNKLKVVIYKSSSGYYSSSSNKALMECYLIEGFNPPATGSWLSTTQSLMTTNISAVIDYVYLGTLNETAVWNSSSKVLTITGGEWDDQVISLVQAQYSAANGYRNITNGTTNNSASFSATKDLGNGYQARIEVSKTTADKIEMRVSKEEAWNVPTSGAWTSSTEALMTTNLTTTLPYVYLGTTAETATWNSSSKALTITGARWDEDQMSVAKAAFDSTWTTSTGSNNYGDTFTAYKDLTGTNYRIRAVLTQSAAHKAVLTVYYEEAFNPSADSAWETTTETLMTTNLGTTLPYIYLATVTESAKWDASKSTLTITGGIWDDRILSLASNTFTASDNWTVSSSTSSTFSAKKIIAGTTNQLSVTITSNSNGKAVLTCLVEEAFIVPSDGAYSTTTQTLISTNLHGIDLPYVYLGTLKETAKWVSSTSTLTITGGAWDDRVLPLVQNAFSSSDSWVADSTAAEGTFSATKFFNNDTEKLIVTLSQSAAGKAVLSVKYEEVFIVPDSGSWSDDITNTLTAKSLPSIPYIYLGTSHPTVDTTYWSGSKYVLINGGTWDDQILTLADTALSNDGWTCTTDATTNTLTATKTDNGANYKITVSKCYYGYPQLKYAKL